MNFESAKYRKKPVVIEAMRWDGSAASATLIVDWILRGGGAASYHKHLMDGDQVAHPGSFLRIQVPHELTTGTVIADPGDYVVRGTREGQFPFYPLRAGEFEATYEQVSA